jgi:hypothetical protein
MVVSEVFPLLKFGTFVYLFIYLFVFVILSLFYILVFPEAFR